MSAQEKKNKAITEAVRAIHKQSLARMRAIAEQRDNEG